MPAHNPPDCPVLLLQRQHAGLRGIAGQHIQPAGAALKAFCTSGKLAPTQLAAGWKANPGKVAKVSKGIPPLPPTNMPRRRDKHESQSDILTPFDLAKKLRGAVQAKDLKTLERLFQRSEVDEMDDRR